MKKIFKIQLLTGFLLLSSVGLLHGGAMLRRAQEYVDAVEKDAVLVASEEIMRLEANRLGFSYLKAIAFGGNLTELDNQVLSLKGSWSDYVKSMIKNDLIGKITKDGFFVSLSILPSWLSAELSRFLIPLRGDVDDLAQGYLASKIAYLYTQKGQTDVVNAKKYISEQLPKAFLSDLELGVNPWWFGMVSVSDTEKENMKNNIKSLLQKKIKDSDYCFVKLKVGNLPGWLSEFENYTDRIVTDPMLADFVASQRSYTYVDKNSAVDQNQLNAERSKITELLKSCVKIENIQGDNVAQEIEYVLVDIGNFSDTTVAKIRTIFINYPELTLVVYSSDNFIPERFNVYGSVKKLSITGRNLIAVGRNFLRECSGLRILQLPSGLTRVGNEFLNYCSGLTILQLPSGLTAVGHRFLYNCSGLTSLQLPSGLTRVGALFLASCSGLTSLQLPSGLIAVDDSFLSDCSGLTILQLPSSLTAVGSSFLSDCSGLTILQLPSSLTAVGSSFLGGCRGLTILQLPSGLTTVGYRPLNHCSGLTTLRVGRNFSQQAVEDLKTDLPTVNIIREDR